MVVAAVVAVRGRSALDMAAAEDDGSLPVISSFRIRDLRSSSSSHTVEGAVVDTVDSVLFCSTSLGLSGFADSDVNLLLRAALKRLGLRASA